MRKRNQKDYHSPPPDVLSRKKLVEMDTRKHYQLNNSPVTTICPKATQTVQNRKCLAIQESWEEILGLELLLCKSFYLKVNLKVLPLPSGSQVVSCLSAGHQDNIQNPQSTLDLLALHSIRLSLCIFWHKTNMSPSEMLLISRKLVKL